QAFWSFGGLFLVDSPEQRRLGIKDSYDLALQDWLGTAGFDRDEDLWPRRWAEAYVAFAAGEKRDWLRAMGHRIFPVVGWAERGESSSRNIVGDFRLRAQAVIVASGGIGGNHDLVRQNWPKRLGEPPKNMISGVPEHVDGRMIGITEAAGGRLINRDRMWHYV